MKRNKSTLILITFFLVACGLLLIYRGLMPVDNYQQFNATIKDKAVGAHDKYNRGQYYSLDLSFVEKEEMYGIYLGTKEQAEKDNLVNEITVGETYKFYIDPSVTQTGNGESLGIRVIEFNGQIIYKENSSANFIGGGLFILLGIMTLILFLYFERKEKRHITHNLRQRG